MTREEAIAMLKNLKNSNGMSTGYTSGFNECIDRAIQALGQIDKIKQIIAIDNSVIQEDVMKYKMICEVVEV